MPDAATLTLSGVPADVVNAMPLPRSVLMPAVCVASLPGILLIRITAWPAVAIAAMLFYGNASSTEALRRVEEKRRTQRQSAPNDRDRTQLREEWARRISEAERAAWSPYLGEMIALRRRRGTEASRSDAG